MTINVVQNWLILAKSKHASVADLLPKHLHSTSSLLIICHIHNHINQLVGEGQHVQESTDTECGYLEGCPRWLSAAEGAAITFMKVNCHWKHHIEHALSPFHNSYCVYSKARCRKRLIIWHLWHLNMVSVCVIDCHCSLILSMEALSILECPVIFPLWHFRIFHVPIQNPSLYQVSMVIPKLLKYQSYCLHTTDSLLLTHSLPTFSCSVSM